MPNRRVISRIFVSLLLAIVVIGGVAVGIDELSELSRDAVHSDTIRPSLSDTRLGQADPLVSLLTQVTEQLNSSRDRIGQLEAQLKQAPGPADLDKARKQGDELRSELAQATGQLKSSQDRIGQLEAQLKQTPGPADLDKARKQGDELSSELAQATGQLKSSQNWIDQLEAQLKQAPAAADLDKAHKELKSSQDRIGQLEAQLKQTPTPADLGKARKQADELRSELAQATGQLKSPQDRIGQLEVQLTSTVNDQANTRKHARYSPSTGPLLDPKAAPDRPAWLPLSPATASPSPDAEPAGRPGPEGALGTVGKSNNPGHVVSAAGPAAAATAPVAITTQALPNTSVETSPLLERGNRLFAIGDVASARLFYERAADSGDGQAALRLGETYDPVFLQRTQLRVPGNRALAVFWYQRARELGSSEAEILLKDTQDR